MDPMPRKRKKLAAALKRNVARRKEAARRQSSLERDADSVAGLGMRSASEPHSGRGQQRSDIGDKVPFHQPGEAP